MKVALKDKKKKTLKIECLNFDILNIFYSEPILKSNEIVSKTGLSKTTVNSILKNMEEKEILSELTNYKRNKMYILRRYFMIFIEGIDLDEI